MPRTGIGRSVLRHADRVPSIGTCSSAGPGDVVEGERVVCRHTTFLWPPACQQSINHVAKNDGAFKARGHGRSKCGDAGDTKDEPHVHR